jgi:hypothetical protein
VEIASNARADGRRPPAGRRRERNRRWGNVAGEHTLSDDEIRTHMPGSASTVEEERPRDTDGTDTQDTDGTDTQDRDTTDTQDQDTTDTQDTDGIDTQDADGTDQ